MSENAAATAEEKEVTSQDTETQVQKESSQNETPAVQKAEFEEASQDSDAQSEVGVDLLLDMTVDITVTIGHAKLSFKEMMQLGPGAVIKLDKLIEEPADIYVKGSKFATGDVVVIDNKFGIRIRDIVC